MIVTVLIPAFREERFIGEVVAGALAQDGLRRVLVVDDGSPDGTAGMARAAGAEVVVHAVNQGKGAALQTGFRWLMEHDPETDYALILDADGQHRPEEIPRFLAAAVSTGSKLLVGNRMGDTAAMPTVRRLTNQTMSASISALCGRRVSDTQCGFRMVHRDLFPLLLGGAARFDYETEMLILAAWRGETIVDVPVSTVYGDEVSSIHPGRDTARFLRLMGRYFLRRMGGERRRLLISAAATRVA